MTRKGDGKQVRSGQGIIFQGNPLLREGVVPVQGLNHPRRHAAPLVGPGGGLALGEVFRHGRQFVMYHTVSIDVELAKNDLVHGLPKAGSSSVVERLRIGKQLERGR
ncbi:hypothetical protein [Amycolatopsis sp. CA-126428]|uniref:hypothetical protein n=1 Tax=Amycolatopsis sp. CA-126428 TaxID=2073158 RepID=UPI0011B06D3D|nr:hypothetical protein [Amycolatopsis sp. CA-126428]